VISDVVTSALGLAGFFSDLPGPIQLPCRRVQAGGPSLGTSILNAMRPMGGILSRLRARVRVRRGAGYARANGDGLGTVLKSVGSYAGGQALSASRSSARRSAPSSVSLRHVFVVGELVDGFQSLTQASDEAKAAPKAWLGR
jgi:hypothetical protein